MKKLVLLPVIFFLLVGCATTSMIKPERAPELVPQPDKATLVMIRDTFFGGAIVFWSYVDGKLIGETMGNNYFVTRVSPGPHHVTIATENEVTYRMDFKPGKIYYLRQHVTMGLWRARTSGLSPLNPQEAREAMKGCTYLELNPKENVGDMDPGLYREALANFENGMKVNPEGYRAVNECQGY